MDRQTFLQIQTISNFNLYIFFSNCDLRPRERDLAYHLARYNSYSILLDIFFISSRKIIIAS